MKSIQVSVPCENSEAVKEILKDESSDIYSVEGEKNDEDVIIFHATVNSSDLDELISELKAVKDIDSGDLVIRIFQEDSLVQKGQKTKGSSTMLSQEEVYSKAQESATFNKPQWALMGLSSAIAAYGLMLDNIAVVIGAMMLAPVLSPLVSGAISLTVGDSTLLKDSFFTTLLSVPLAVLVASISVLFFQPSLNPTMNMIVSSGVPNLILSLFVGSAAALAFVTGLRDQIAGVAVSIALVPPLAAAGIGLTMQNYFFAINAASIATVNLLAVLVSGSVSLKLLGFSPSTYYREKSAEKMRYLFPVAVSLMLLAVYILLFSPL